MYTYQYYPANITKCKPTGFTTIEQFIQAHKEPSPKTTDIFKKIADAESNGDMKLKAELKQNNLLYYTPCVHIKDWRKYDNITVFTGLLVLDFDHIDNAKAFKEYLFNEYSYIISAWLSPSKRGVKALVKIPVIEVQNPISKSIDVFKEYFRAITEIMEVYDGFDEINKNPTQPLFQANDPELLFREDATTFYKRKPKQKFIPKPSIQPCYSFSSNEKKEMIIRLVKRKMDEIVDNGHPQLLRIAFTLGGYVGGGYLSQNEAETLIHSLIGQHGYLSKGISNYQKTASTCISEGMNEPLDWGY